LETETNFGELQQQRFLPYMDRKIDYGAHTSLSIIWLAKQYEGKSNQNEKGDLMIQKNICETK